MARILASEMQRGQGRDRRPLLIAALFAVLSVGTLGAVQRVEVAACTSILVASSNEKSDLIDALARDYSAAHPQAPGCSAAVVSERVPSGQAERQLAHGWGGPTRPDVWLPAASTWLVLLRYDLQAASKPGLLPSSAPAYIASSPLVVGMPQPMAQALGWPAHQPSWGDLLALSNSPTGWGRFGHPEWGAFRLAQTDPGTSTSGLHALIAAYYAATGKASDLFPADVGSASTRAFVSGLEKSVSHYADTADTFLRNLSAADDAGQALSYVSAVTVEEQELWQYDQGAYSETRVAPRVPLVAVYPRDGTLMADHPYVTLQAPWVTMAKQQLAADFLDWLLAPDQQARFTQLGFRDYRGVAGGPLALSSSVLPAQPEQLLRSPEPATLGAIEDAWPSLRKPGRLLLLLDAADRASLRETAAALDELSAGDVVAVWAIVGKGQPSAYQVLVSWTPVGTGRAELESVIRSAPTTASARPLHAAIAAAFDYMLANPDASRVNAVVLLAGTKDDGSGPDLASLVRHVRPAPGGVPDRVYAVAFAGSDQAALREIATASGGYFVTGEPGSAVRRALVDF